MREKDACVSGERMRKIKETKRSKKRWLRYIFIYLFIDLFLTNKIFDLFLTNKNFDLFLTNK